MEAALCTGRKTVEKQRGRSCGGPCKELRRKLRMEMFTGRELKSNMEYALKSNGTQLSSMMRFKNYNIL